MKVGALVAVDLALGLLMLTPNKNFMISLRSRRKRGRGRGARSREKNGGLGARDEGTPATKRSSLDSIRQTDVTSLGHG